MDCGRWISESKQAWIEWRVRVRVRQDSGVDVGRGGKRDRIGFKMCTKRSTLLKTKRERVVGCVQPKEQKKKPGIFIYMSVGRVPAKYFSCKAIHTMGATASAAIIQTVARTAIREFSRVAV